jgi:predicted acetyltransferase
VRTIKLVEIKDLDELNYLSYISSWKEMNETLSPSSCDMGILSFIEWQKRELLLQNEETLPEGFVRAETLFLVEDNGYILGAINLRYAMTESLLRYGGHLSFGIRPEERQKGYAFIMVKLALNRLRMNGIKKALVTVKRSNKAVKNTVRKIGGTLENAYEEDGHVIDRYWIAL